MKKCMTVIVALTLATLAQANDFQNAKLLGKVKSVDEKMYTMTISFGQFVQDKTPMERWIYTYDAKGNMTERIVYFYFSPELSKWVYAYDVNAT